MCNPSFYIQLRQNVNPQYLYCNSAQGRTRDNLYLPSVVCAGQKLHSHAFSRLVEKFEPLQH